MAFTTEHLCLLYAVSRKKTFDIFLNKAVKSQLFTMILRHLKRNFRIFFAGCTHEFAALFIFNNLQLCRDVDDTSLCGNVVQRQSE